MTAAAFCKASTMVGQPKHYTAKHLCTIHTKTIQLKFSTMMIHVHNTLYIISDHHEREDTEN